MARLTPVDAQTFWVADKIPNDQFVVYGFARVPDDVDAALDAVRLRAARTSALTVRIEDADRLRYPAWVPCDVSADQVVAHELDDPTWRGALAATIGLAQLDARERPWRVHVFTGVEHVPGAAGAGTVAVLQLSHALADGVRGSAIGAWLFGREVSIPSLAPVRFGALALPWRTVRAVTTQRRLARDIAAGLVPGPRAGCPMLSINDGSGPAVVRTLVRSRAALPGPTVTVAVLSAVSEALAGFLRERGEDPSQLGAEVPMAKAGPRTSHNHFGNVGVGLHPELDGSVRRSRIAAELVARRQRAAQPANQAAALAFAATPAPLLRWGVGRFDPTVRSATVTGNTVVSSVNRGAADLHFGGAPVTVTTGFPGLSPMMGLTHGVHGIGDTVAVSVHAAERAIGDVDAYLDRLAAALG